MNENLKPVSGMMAAIELSRFNIPVRLIEKKAEPETTSRASLIMPVLLKLFRW